MIRHFENLQFDNKSNLGIIQITELCCAQMRAGRQDEIYCFIYFPTPLYTKTRCQAGFCVIWGFYCPQTAGFDLNWIETHPPPFQCSPGPAGPPRRGSKTQTAPPGWGKLNVQSPEGGCRAAAGEHRSKGGGWVSMINVEQAARLLKTQQLPRPLNLRARELFSITEKP